MDTKEKITLENFLAERYSVVNEEDKVDNFLPDTEVTEETREKKQEENEFLVEGVREGDREEPMLVSKKQQKRAVAKRQQELKLKKQQKLATKGTKGKKK